MLAPAWLPALHKHHQQPLRKEWRAANMAATLGPNSGSNELQPHANILCRNIPPDMDVGSFQALFRPYGLVEGCRYFPSAKVPYAFIKLESVASSHAAIRGLNNTYVRGHQLQVKSADVDCEYEKPNTNLYTVNIPMHWDEDRVKATFAQYGAVLSIRMLAPVQGLPGKGAMVRLANIEDAKRARDELNAKIPPGEQLPLLVKFADSAEDKARKNSARTQGGHAPAAASRYSPYPGAAPTGRPSQQGADGMEGRGPRSGAAGYSGAYAPPAAGGADASYGASAPYPAGQNGHGYPAPGSYDAYGNPTYGQPYGAKPAYAYPPAAATPTHVQVAGLPPTVDRLALYENFAPYGGIIAVTQPVSGMVWITYVDTPSAERASANKHGTQLQGYTISATVHPPATQAVAPTGPVGMAPVPQAMPVMGY